ncbi:aminotransferase class III-fold pyridoxal phosphate-dependent enzyme [Prochlorococcus sp. MIT 1307]|uniref:aminotransferase class III-fold pyridoxal phosphate-dependent enzyme n=1 Tax=Prochlorococcus sp. MIT 1307 TaxID=3096219 RepID=UPI002A75F25E|nr:aminotransferase class III-fold pyridoxal phosphate-dependent enzyme [Prochlorococcus sp. MIT 1307]
MNKMKKQQFTAIIQARMGSTRLPGKVLADISGRPMLEFMIERVKRCELLDHIIIATTELDEDNAIELLGQKLNITIVRGSTKDVLSRYHKAALTTHSENLVRLTADCPLLDPNLIDRTIVEYINSGVDYLSNSYPPTFPDGLDVEVFRKKCLLASYLKCNEPLNREHVTVWIRESNNYMVNTYKSRKNYSNMRWTVDEAEDLEVVRMIVEHFEGRSDFSWEDVIELEKLKPSIFEINSKIKRNEGFNIGTGQKLYKRAKKLIPGGNMLLSKRPEMFLPEGWPSYFSKARGCKVWDLDGSEYTDMSIMGIGTNILGYGCLEVDEAVKLTIERGNMSTFNCPEEVELAEKLVSMHPWSDMVRFARTGGEANAIAVRIARASKGKDKIAICGYHGWHDWYLATNLKGNLELKDHLLPGLEANGVPKSLEDTVIPFTYNDLEEIEKIANKYNLAAIKMEVERSSIPKKGYLEGIRKLCDSKGIILIFDECTSGFRETFGGLHLKYGVDPDIAIFGKALGNGYSITCVLGRKEIMQSAQSTFMSSTFWTERIGPTAALKTLEVMERNKSWEEITSKGNYFRNKINKMANKYELEISLKGLASLSTFTFSGTDSLKYKTLITQQMLRKGYLASNTCYMSTAHSIEIINDYMVHLEKIFKLIKECETGREDIDELLTYECCHSSFKRLN